MWQILLDAGAHPDVGDSDMSLAEHAILHHRADILWSLQVCRYRHFVRFSTRAPLFLILGSLVFFSFLVFFFFLMLLCSFHYCFFIVLLLF